MGREKPLHIYGLHHVIDRIEGMMDFYDWGDWPGFFPVVFYRMPESELMILLKADQIKITASPVSHLVPTLGIRMDFSDTSLSYSCDTEPSPAVQKLAEGVDLLIHEATGKGKGHSSPEEAGQVARKAGAKQLCLIHYPPQADIEELARAAGTEFSGKVIVAQDLMRIKLGV
jgi:ribonuclease Z